MRAQEAYELDGDGLAAPVGVSAAVEFAGCCGVGMGC